MKCIPKLEWRGRSLYCGDYWMGCVEYDEEGPDAGFWRGRCYLSHTAYVHKENIHAARAAVWEAAKEEIGRMEFVSLGDQIMQEEKKQWAAFVGDVKEGRSILDDIEPQPASWTTAGRLVSLTKEFSSLLTRVIKLESRVKAGEKAYDLLAQVHHAWHQKEA